MNENIRRFAMALRKELRYVTTQKAFTLISLGAPLLAFLVFFILLQSDITLPVEVLKPASPEAGRVAGFMENLRNPAGTPYFDVELVSPERAHESLAAGDRVALIEVPADPLQVKHGVGELGLTIHYGNVNTNLIKNIIDRVNIACVRFLEENILGASRLVFREHTVYETDVNWITFMTTGMYVYALLLSGSIAGGVTMTKEVENRTMLLLRLAPGRMGVVYAAKAATALVLTSLAGLIFIGAASLFHGFSPAEPGLLLGTSALLAAIGVLLGLFLGLLIGSSLMLFLTLLVTNLAMWVIGGGFGVPGLFSTPVRLLSRILPTTYGMNLVRKAVLGAGLSGTSVDAVALVIFIAILGFGLYVVHHVVVERVV